MIQRPLILVLILIIFGSNIIAQNGYTLKNQKIEF